MLDELSRGICGPLDGRLRPYLLKDSAREIYEWSIGNCRFSLGGEETQELCVILDEYVQTYIRELYRREKEYDLEPFCLSRSGIRLFYVRAAICDAMFRYIENAPDRYEGLHLECNLGMLRLDNAGGGLHFMIVLERVQTPVWNSDSEYWFTLKPYYGDADGIMDTEKLWPPAKVCSWLTDVLLPDALTYALQKAVPHGFLRGRRRKEWIRNRIDSEIKSLHQSLDQADRRISERIGGDRELYRALEKLQSRFALATSEYYYGDELQKLGETLVLMLEKAELKQTSYAYISGKLGCAGSKDSVLAYLRARSNAQGEKEVFTAGRLEVILRCTMECMREKRAEFGFQTIRRIEASLSSLIKLYNKELLLDKYRKMLE